MSGLAPGATVSWDNATWPNQIRVYLTDKEGFLYESKLDGGSPWQSPTKLGPQVVVGTPISAFCTADGTSIRIYFTSAKSGQAQEWCTDGDGWYQGQFTA